MAPHALIADDEPDIREIISLKLRDSGFTVTAVENGAACLDYLRSDESRQPDVVLMDVMMPEMDGFSALERIRESSGFVDLPVVMLTSRGREEDVMHALDAGATDFIAKPISPSEIVGRLERVLG